MHPDVDQFVNGKPIMVLTQKGKKFLEAIQYCKFTKFGDVLASVAGTETNEEIIDLLMKLSEKMRNRENPFYNVTSPSDL